ncbi:MAG TPA: DUF86 domain-containing protein [Kiritimatiellia bacterium]|nr:DUF86 domain-containing protein [Kiritimatiellia bacterium]
MIPTTRANLADVLDSCRFIQTTCATRTFDDYQKDRNRLTHGYDSIDDAIVWGIVSGHLPLLISEVEAALNSA